MDSPNLKFRKVVVIGAGIGGLSAACLLAADGCKVTVIEKNDGVGGKMNIFEKAGYRFDTGPSLLTMPGIITQLFEYCGENVKDYLTFVPLEPVCRYWYNDGVRFDAFDDLKRTQDEIRRFAPEDVEAYAQFLTYSQGIYERTADVFLFHPLRSFKDLFQLPVGDVLKIDAFTTVSKRVDKMVSSTYMRKFLKRFTTYNGSSPYKAPATINVIPHVEMNQGGYYVKGGLYEIARALEKLAEKLNVKFKKNTTVRRIDMHDDTAEGVTTEDGYFSADLVVANSDAHETYLNLLPHYVTPGAKRRQIDNLEPSCSGFVLMLGCNKRWNEKLVHHTLFFSDNYEAEFEDIFEHKKLPDQPTIYVANTSYTDPNHAPTGGSNLFILVNAPYIHDSQDWDELETIYSERIIAELEKRGLDGLKESIVVRETITPRDFYSIYRSNRGSIYGTSSNSRFSAFMRPRNRSPYVENVWLVGGSTHPGGGIPLAILSAFHACGVPIDSDRVAL